MAKGRNKLNSDDGVAPAQLRSLRSRKRERLSEETSEAENVQPTICPQDSGGTNATMDATPLQSPEQESAVVSTQQHQLEGEPSPTKEDPVAEEITADTANVTVEDFEEKEKEKVTDANGELHQVGFTVHPDEDADQSEKDEERNRNVSQICPHQLYVVLPILEESKVSAKNALEEQAGANEDSAGNLERSQETSLEETSSRCTTGIKTGTLETVVEVPARKKRRMGMCGLTEKERSHFLQTQKRENGPKEPERAEMLIESVADPVGQKDTTASPKPPSVSLLVGCVSEQSKAAVKLQPRDFGEDVRAEAELHIAVTASDGTSTVCDPGCSVEKSFEVDGVTVPRSEQTQETLQTADSRLDLPAVEGEEEDGAVEDQSPALSKAEQTEDRAKCEAPCLQMNGVPISSDEKKEAFTCDEAVHEVSKAGVSSSQSQSEDFNCGSVVLRDVAVTPCGSEGNYSFVPDDEPDAGPSSVITEPLLTGNTSDLFGPCCLEYVSDSQLNTISLIEEEAMERDEVPSVSDCREDASELICGLIRELSTLNRKVMATHKELENLRRSTKSSRSSTR